MANIVWPEELPQTPLYDGYQETFPNMVLRTQMDAGLPKMRRRFTAAPRPMKFQLSLTNEQAALLDEFFTSTCRGGSERFEWAHPRTTETVEVRFTKPPTMMRLGPDLWKAQCEVEQVPIVAA